MKRRAFLGSERRASSILGDDDGAGRFLVLDPRLVQGEVTFAQSREDSCQRGGMADTPA